MKKYYTLLLVIFYYSNTFSQNCITAGSASPTFVSASGLNCTYNIPMSVTTVQGGTKAVRFTLTNGNPSILPVCKKGTTITVNCALIPNGNIAASTVITHTFSNVIVPCNVAPIIVIQGTTSDFNGGSICDEIAVSTSTASPVTLSYFKGFANSNKITLSWQTEAETNSSHFVVQRSGNAKEFGNLETLKSAGESTNKINYQFSDKNPLVGINYYRLLQVDKDGSVVHSKIIDINSEGGASEVIIYPNPSDGKFILKSNELILSADAFNSSSQAVDVNLEKNTEGYSLNFKDKPTSGTYYLRVKTQTKATKYRIVVE